ncbi:MAG: S8 family serine peptidase [Acidobacteria bacterium]|nr:S8 family serine peptidase [Acidobacteriota bacterium]
MKSSKNLVTKCSRSKAAVCIALIAAMFAVYEQPGFAVTASAPKTNAQLLGGLLGGGGLLPSSRYIVRDTRGLLGLNLTCLVFGCKVVEGIGDPDGQLYVVQVATLLSPLVCITQLLSGAGITNVEPDQAVSTQGTNTVGSLPPYISDRTPVSYYGATVWDGYVEQTPNEIINTEYTQSTIGATGSGVTVALIDTGVDPNNTILQSHLVNGYDFTRNKTGGSEMVDVNQSTVGVVDGNAEPAQVNQSTVGVVDQSTVGVVDNSQYSAFGHGTMTAGIVHLVAPQAKLMPLKSFNAAGQGLASDVLRAIYYAVNHGAKVINMSFDFTSPSQELATAINYATLRGVICVASAGNDGKIEAVYPASLPNVIDVASTSLNNSPSAFSNYGAPPVWLSAPGEAVMTTYPGNTYAVGWGTSFSAPLVSGTVALMAQTNSLRLTKSSAASSLSHAQPIPYSQFGYGVLDTYQAVKAWQNSQGLGLTLP